MNSKYKDQRRLVYINRHMHYVCGTLGRAVIPQPYDLVPHPPYQELKNNKGERERGRKREARADKREDGQDVVTGLPY